MGPGSSRRVSNASPVRISTNASRPASARFPAAAFAFVADSSVVMIRPAPLSRAAAAR